jgi:hypothetical protein
VSLVHVEIVTGRTHQVRVHLSHLGTPVLGDDTYSTPEMAKRNLRYRKLGCVGVWVVRWGVGTGMLIRCARCLAPMCDVLLVKRSCGLISFTCCP